MKGIIIGLCFALLLALVIGSTLFGSTVATVDVVGDVNYYAVSFHGDGGNLTNISADGGFNPFDQDLNVSDVVAFFSISGDGGNLTNVSGVGSGNIFDQDLNTTDDVLFGVLGGNGTGLYWLNWSNLTGVPAGFLDGVDDVGVVGNIFDQDLNTTDTVTFFSIAGDGGNLTNLTGVSGSNIFDQDLNATDSPTFVNVTMPTQPGNSITIASSTSYNSIHADYTCDGVNDDIEINDAIQFLNTSTGGIVYLLDGQFNISNWINGSSNVSIVGSGHSTIINIGSGCQYGIYYLRCNNFSVSDLKITSVSQSIDIQYRGIRYSRCQDAIIRGVYLYDIADDFVSSTGSDCIDLSWCDNILVEGCFINSDDAHYGIYTWDSDFIVIDSNIIEIIGHHGIAIRNDLGVPREQNSSSIVVSNNVVKNFGNDTGSIPNNGIAFHCVAHGNIVGNTIFNVPVDCNGISFEESALCVVDGNSIYGSTATNDSSVGIFVNGEAKQNLFSDNSIQGCEDGILISDTGSNIDNMFTNNYIGWTGWTGINISSGRNVVSNNFIIDTGVGILLNDDRCVVDSNRITDASAYSIKEMGTADFNRLFDNCIKTSERPLLIGTNSTDSNTFDVDDGIDNLFNLYYDNSEVFSVDSDGHVNATSYWGDGSHLTGVASAYWVEEGADVYLDNSYTNVGFGTEDPNKDFHFSDSGNIDFSIESTAADGWNVFHFYSDSVQKCLLWYDATANSFHMAHKESGVNSNDKFFTIKEGQMGLNDSTPAAQLEVEGNIIYSGTITDDSDERIKSIIDSLSDDDVARFCSAVSIYNYYLYDYWEDGFGNVVVGDLSDVIEIGIVAQKLYDVVVDCFGVEYVDYFMNVGNETSLWTVNYFGVGLVFDRYVQILSGRVDSLELRLSLLESEVFG